MDKFFVGQRVRVVYRDAGSAERNLPNGAEGIIQSPGDVVDWRVRFPLFRNPRLNGRHIFPMWEDEMEPVLDIHEPCESDFKESLDKLLEGLPA